ncbi:imidazole glycerol phosphate synthase subunit HisH [Candidatus Formimonas warabiya]|uniref:Imidazole glycerol phosphate synthase subunit HisH n=1 Tax=Formimonas warabiya TaxID=1761012 RepID=A0A3G1KLT9_FORW1|nr:imidazole glycerol phosphate synthase subunit HisH [Candidatus Formimonas warabiya]ATW23406.1 imidazole glycerol phosphate synthase, glutamine amidotransferase subunit [Candidatus Formimonas warabiya]
MIAIIDYGMGNLRSVQKGFEKVGYAAFITNDPQKALEASGVVLPGVGAFEDAMKNLRHTGFLDAIKQVVRQEKPLLGICLGMQLFFEESEENGVHQGLGLLSGKVVRFRLPDDMKVPHMGWNQIRKEGDCPILHGISCGAYFYFVHSFYVAPENFDFVGAITNYGVNFASVVGRGKIFGVQFHPEKSTGPGLHILKNFGVVAAQ